MAVHPIGMTFNVNEANAEALRSLFLTLGAGAEPVDSLVDAILDWRDPDTEPRPFGAERGWLYLANGRHPPRDGPLTNARELRRIRGLEDMPDLESVLGVEPGRVSLSHAPAAVLASIPGFGPEAVRADPRARNSRSVAIDLATLAGGLSSGARRELIARFANAARATTTEPEGIVVARGYAGQPPITVAIEVKLVRAGRRAAIVRRRVWLQ